MDEVGSRVLVGNKNLKGPGADLNEDKQADTLSDLVANSLKYSFLFRFIQRTQGIVDLPVNELSVWKVGALRPGQVAQCNDEVEIRFADVTHGFRDSVFKVNADLLHNFDREGMNSSTTQDTRAGDVKVLGIESRQ
jgi:hypothetical protein